MYQRILLMLSCVLLLNGFFNAPMAQENLPKEVTVKGIEFILIPAGWFYIGQDLNDKADPLAKKWYNKTNMKKIWLDDFYLAKYEIRSKDFAEYLNATGHEKAQTDDEAQCIVRKGADGVFRPIPGKENHPANGLSWVGADAFAKWFGFRLPTESEWIKAARGTDKRHFPWGNILPDQTFSNYGMGVFSKKDAPDLLFQVDSYPKGISPYGIYNMSGNIREWVSDWYSKTYVNGLEEGAKNPKGPETGTRRMMKGGRWADMAWDLQVWSKYPDDPEFPFQCNGVRFAADVETILQHLEQ